MTEKFRPLWFRLWFIVATCSFPWLATAQEISPAQEQQLIDARSALEAAQKGNAGKYAPDTLKWAQDFIGAAEKARQRKDSVRFARASQLGRAYAELARALSELNAEEERLAVAREELQRTKAEIDRLKISQ